MSELTIISYGGGEILFKLFTGIQMLFNSGFIKMLSFLMASISAVYVVFSSYFSSNIDGIFKGWFIPTLALIVLCFSIKTTVYIEDKLPLSQGGINILSGETCNGVVGYEPKSSWTVDKVPLFVGVLSKAISTIGHKITEAVELVFHSPDDPKYSQKGMIFGAETALDMSEISICDGDLEANMRTFCRTCMLYDLALNLYSIKDLKESNNLLNFLKRKTAKSRFMNYVDKSGDDKKETTLITCNEAIDRISKKLERGGSEVAHQEKKQIFRHLPIAYQALTKQSGNSSEIIQQMIAMSVVSEELSSEAFAKKRAALQQKTTWKTMGGIADGLVITTRSVIEALVYGAILFVVPLAFLPSGFNYFKTWIWLLVWIQLWPPFYAILDYVSLIAARGQADGLFDPGSAGTCCLTLYNTTGLSNVYSNVSSYAKSMKVLVPFLSYAILQGGVGSFVHMTSSMFGASQSAASMAASDDVSGNYSFANSSMDTANFANATYAQQNLSPSVSRGYIRSEDISGIKAYGNSESTYEEKYSKTSSSISIDNAIQSSISKTLTTSQTAHESASMNLNESISQAGRSALDYTNHLAFDSSYSYSNSTSESADVSKSASFVTNQVESFAKDHGISHQKAMDLIASASLGVGGASFRASNTESNTWSDAQSIAESKDFREAFNHVLNHAENYSNNQTDGEGHRLANSFTNSLDQLKSASESFTSSLDHLNQAQDASSWYENQSISGRKDITQDFIDDMIDNQGYTINQVADLIHNNSNSSLGRNIDDYISSRVPTFTSPENFQSPDDFFTGQKDGFNGSAESLKSPNTELVESNIPENLNRDLKTTVIEHMENAPQYDSVKAGIKEDILQKKQELIDSHHPKEESVTKEKGMEYLFDYYEAW